MLALFKRFIAWLLAVFVEKVRKEEPKLMAMSITLPNIGPVPLSAFEQIGELLPLIIDGLKSNKSAEAIKSDLEAKLPEVTLAIAENILNVLFPGSGTLLEVLAWMVNNSSNNLMTQDQENAWFARFGAGNA